MTLVNTDCSETLTEQANASLKGNPNSQGILN